MTSFILIYLIPCIPDIYGKITCKYTDSKNVYVRSDRIVEYTGFTFYDKKGQLNAGCKVTLEKPTKVMYSESLCDQLL